MKQLYLFILFSFFANVFCLNAQQASNLKKGNSHKEQDIASKYVENELIVKFKSDVKISSGKTKTASKVNALLKSLDLHIEKEIFSKVKKSKSRKQYIITPQGEKLNLPDLSNVFLLKLNHTKVKSAKSQNVNLYEIKEELQKDESIDYVEFNYLYSIGDFKTASKEMSESEFFASQGNQNVSEEASGFIPNDPLYNSQWWISASKIDNVWNDYKGDGSSIIAILDTGVDWEHADLAANIWTNEAELNGIEGYDDDGNGFIDDIHGWDFVNQDNDPKDDNSHGTHCAGIAAAVGNNEKGITGANMNAKIMPVKVIQSSGYADAASIAKGVDYAAANGATVLSMSFGSYAESITLRNALANAYASAVLVAAAGNDGLCIGPGRCNDNRIGKPVYPGAFSFVLGIEANAKNSLASFSNFDQDGPVTSQYPDLLNYELKAPGQDIISTVPGGNYQSYNGTSMATPLVAGALSLYLEQRSEDSQEVLFGNFINAKNGTFDLYAALHVEPNPCLNIVSYKLTDELDGDGDKRADAGETIELKVKVRNTWQKANDVKVAVEFAENEDRSIAEILTVEAEVGSISAYSTAENEVSLKLKLKDNLVDGRDIVLNLKAWYGDHKGECDSEIVIHVENGVELKGIIEEDMTLTPDKHYIVTDNLAIQEGCTLTIEPGTTLKFASEKTLMIAGTLIAKGNAENVITFTKRDLETQWGGVETSKKGTLIADYCIFEYIFDDDDDYMRMYNPEKILIKNSIFRYNEGLGIMLYGENTEISHSTFYYNKHSFTSSSFSPKIFNANNVISNYNNAIDKLMYASGSVVVDEELCIDGCNIFSNIHTPTNKEINLSSGNNDFTICHLKPTYFGRTNKDTIASTIFDYQIIGEGVWIDISKKLDRPSAEAHGIVWKILVNGVDAQDDFELLDPVGVGKQKFEIYFNRSMDKDAVPQVSMGVREPFTQTAIAEEGSWNEDGTIYTVYSTIGLNTGDGINTIRVEGAKDLDHFEIPIEERRFRVLVAAAGSLSDGFSASAGMGKINLEWTVPEDEVDDLLGYNIYRYTYIDEKNTSEKERINKKLLTNNVYTDFDVTPDTQYFYSYKTVRTNLSESDYSKVVAAKPLTAEKGDANGDLAVNIIDVTTTVSQILQQEPKPFIFNAADINEDEQINVLDIAGIINLIVNPSTSSTRIAQNYEAEFYVSNDTLYVNSPVEMGALQFSIQNLDNYKILESLNHFEVASSKKDDELILLAYSLKASTLSKGETALLKLSNSDINMKNLLVSSMDGRKIDAEYSQKIPEIKQDLKLEIELSNYPNPFVDQTKINIELGTNADRIEMTIYDLNGRIIDQIIKENISMGSHQIDWFAKNRRGGFISVLKVIKDGKLISTKKIKMISE